MDDTKEYKIKRKVRARNLYRDFVSFFENEYGFRFDNAGNLENDAEDSTGEKLIYNWDGTVLSGPRKKEDWMRSKEARNNAVK